MRKAAIVALVLLVAGTGMIWAGGTQERAAAQEVTVTPPGTFPIVEEPVTVRMLAAQGPDIEDLNTNEFAKFYEELTNVRVVFEQFPVAQQAERLNIVMASGDYPEVITGGNIFNRTQLLVYGSQGVFLPLNDLIANHMVHMQDMFEYNDYFRETLTAPDGNIYGYPRVAETTHVTHPNKMWIYQPFLQELGIDPPRTTSEFRDMLIAFRDQDPNRSGRADTVPLAGTMSGATSVVDYLMASFIYPDPSRIMVDNGTLRFVANTPEWRDGLRYLRELYTEGLIAEESFTQDVAQLRQLGENPNTPILGAFPGLALGNATVVGGESGRYLEFKTIPPLEGPTGIRQAIRQPFPVVISTVITEKANHPAVVARWIDHFYTPLEGPLWAEYGLEGSGWERAQPGETGLDGRPAFWRPIRPWGQMQNIAWVHTVGFFNSEEKRNSQVASATDQETILYTETVNNYIPYGADSGLPPLFLDEAQALEMARLQADIIDHVNSSAARFIVGDLDIERNWDTYVTELERMGVRRYVEIYQAAYNAKSR